MGSHCSSDSPPQSTGTGELMLGDRALGHVGSASQDRAVDKAVDSHGIMMVPLSHDSISFDIVETQIIGKNTDVCTNPIPFCLPRCVNDSFLWIERKLHQCFLLHLRYVKVADTRVANNT